MGYLSILVFSEKDLHMTLVSKNRYLIGVMWVERYRRYLVSTTGTTNPDEKIYHQRWISRNGTPVLESIEISIPMVCEHCYDICSEIDRHNRCRQDDLGLEKKFEVKDWATRVHTSLLAICIVESWKLYSGCKRSTI